MVAIGRAGSATELGRLLGISQAAVSQWEVVPDARVIDVEEATGVSRHDLAPEMYPDPVHCGGDA